MIGSKQKYFASRNSEECIKVLDQKTDNWIRYLAANGYLDKVKKTYLAYYGAYSSGIGDAHQMRFTGDSGELTSIDVNHLRNLAEHMIVMTSSSKPAMEARAVNTDEKTAVQVNLANGLLDYYMREKKLDEYLKLALESSVAMATGWIKLGWNSRLGSVMNKEAIDEATEMEEEIPAPEYEGDIEITNIPALQVIMDINKDSTKDHDWYICQNFKNRFNIIAKYPELEEEILKIETRSELQVNRFGDMGNQDESDDVAVYEFYHQRSEALPEGRYLQYLSDKAVLYDGPLPYRKIPLYRISPSSILNSPLGFTPLFSLLPLQETVNMLYSTILSNQAAFGVQTILNPSGNGIDVSQLSEGLNIINYNNNIGPPVAMNFTRTPQEVFQFLQQIVKDMETLSGVNAVARGNPEASLRSGSALALIQGNSIQFMSGLQAAYTSLIENVGIGLIEILQDFADSPRIATIVGISGRSHMKKFKNTDLMSINRVVVDAANPLTKTIAGRVSIAADLIQYGEITAEQYLNVITTGSLSSVTEAKVNKMNAIRSENEAMMLGEKPRMLVSDDHLKHFNEHKSILDDHYIRQDEALSSIVLEHMKEHFDALKNTDPMLLQMLGQQPLMPPPMPPGPPPGDMQEPTNGLPPEAANATPEDELMMANGNMPPDMSAQMIGDEMGIPTKTQDIRRPEGFSAMNGNEGMVQNGLMPKF